MMYEVFDCDYHTNTSSDQAKVRKEELHPEESVINGLFISH